MSLYLNSRHVRLVRRVAAVFIRSQHNANFNIEGLSVLDRAHPEDL